MPAKRTARKSAKNADAKKVLKKTKSFEGYDMHNQSHYTKVGATVQPVFLDFW
jgi:hypothetical protein